MKKLIFIAVLVHIAFTSISQSLMEQQLRNSIRIRNGHLVADTYVSTPAVYTDTIYFSNGNGTGVVIDTNNNVLTFFGFPVMIENSLILQDSVTIDQDGITTTENETDYIIAGVKLIDNTIILGEPTIDYATDGMMKFEDGDFYGYKNGEWLPIGESIWSESMDTAIYNGTVKADSGIIVGNSLSTKPGLIEYNSDYYYLYGSANRYIRADRYFRNVKDYGATGNGASDDYAAIQEAFDEGSGMITIGESLADTFLLSQPIYLENKNNITIEINGVIKIQDGYQVALSVNTNSSNKYVVIPHADAAKFSAGQWVTVSDTSVANYDTNDQYFGSTFLIDSIKSVIAGNTDTIYFPDILGVNYLTTKKAQVGHTQSVFVFVECDDIKIKGSGIVDGNYQNQFHTTAPAWYIAGVRSGTETRSATCISVISGDNLNIPTTRLKNISIEGITLKNSQLFGLCLYGTDTVKLKNVTFLDHRDKALLGYSVHGIDIINCIFKRSLYEDAISFYYDVWNIRIIDCEIDNMGRYGIINNSTCDKMYIANTFIQDAGKSLHVLNGEIDIDNLHINRGGKLYGGSRSSQLAFQNTSRVNINNMVLDSCQGTNAMMLVGNVKNFTLNGASISYAKTPGDGSAIVFGLSGGNYPSEVYINNLDISNNNLGIEGASGVANVVISNCRFRDNVSNSNGVGSINYLNCTGLDNGDIEADNLGRHTYNSTTYFDDTVYFDAKVFHDSSTYYNGNIQYLNTFWDDLRSPATTTKQGATSKPTFDYDSLALVFPDNDSTEVAYYMFQMPHTYKSETSIYPHVHWIQHDDTDSVQFAMEYRLWKAGTRSDNVWNYIISTHDKEFVYDGAGAMHQIASFDPINMQYMGKSSLIDIKLWQVEDAGNLVDAYVKDFDIHFEVESPGSENQLPDEIFVNSSYYHPDGVDEYLSFTRQNFGNQYTIAFWIQWDSVSGVTCQYRTALGHTVALGRDGASVRGWTGTAWANRFHTGDAAGTVYQSCDIRDGNWHYLLVTRTSAGVCSFYKDNAYVGDGSSSLTSTLQPSLIGRNVTDYSVMGLDEVVVYNSVLGATERTLLYGGGTPETCGNPRDVSGILFYASFEQGIDNLFAETDDNGTQLTLTKNNLEKNDIESH